MNFRRYKSILMDTVFWLITLLLISMSFVFVLPWLRSSFLLMMFTGVFIIIISYVLYFKWGSSQYLQQYYSPQAKLSRVKQLELRLLLAEFRKEEFRLRARLEKNSQDQDAEWRLLDLLAIKAMQDREYPLAIQYWKNALLKIPNDKTMELEKERITRIMNVVYKAIN